MAGQAQPDFAELLRRRRLAQLMSEQGQSNADIPETQQPIVPGQDTSGEANLNAVLPYSAPQQPTASTAARDAYAQFLKQPAPEIMQYHPSTGRRIAAAILGGFAGAGGYPKAGQEFLYAPFTREQASYGATGQRLKEAAATETAQEKEGLSTRETEAKIGAESERAQAEHARAGAEEERRKALSEPPPELEKKLYNLKLKDGSTIQGARYYVPQYGPDKGKGYYVDPSGNHFGDNSIESAEEQPPAMFGKISNAVQEEVQAFYQQNKRLPNSKEMEDILTRTSQATGQFQQREASTALAQERTKQIESLIKPVSPQEVQIAQRQRDQDPGAYWKYLQSLPPLQRRGVMVAVPPPRHLTTTQEDRIGNSNVTLWHVETLRDMLKDPFIKENLGPIIGRINLADSTWGGNDVAQNPQDVQKEQAFLSFLTSNLLWETTSGVGTRPARQTIELIKRTAPRASESVDRIMGALEAEERSARNVQKGLTEGGPEEKIKKPGDFSDIREVQ